MSQWEEGVVDPMQPLASVCHKFPRFSLQHLARLTFGTSGTLGLSLFNPVDSGTVSRSILSSDFGNLNRGLRRQIRRVWDLGLQAGCILALPYQVKFRTPLRASLTQCLWSLTKRIHTYYLGAPGWDQVPTLQESLQKKLGLKRFSNNIS